MSEGVQRATTFSLIILGVLLFALATAPFLLDVPKKLTSIVSSAQEVRTIYLNDTPIRVLVADEPSEWERGLGGTRELTDAQGMLFIFREDGRYGIWMKDMYMSIDIIWISAEGRVVYMEQGISPETYPNSFKNTDPARFVLEVPAGLSEVYGLSVGSTVSL